MLFRKLVEMMVESLLNEFLHRGLPCFDGVRLHDCLRDGGCPDNSRILHLRRDDVGAQMLFLAEDKNAIVSLGRQLHAFASYHFTRDFVRLAHSLGLRALPLAAAHLHKLRYDLPIVCECGPVRKDFAGKLNVVVIAVLVCYDDGVPSLGQGSFSSAEEVGSLHGGELTDGVRLAHGCAYGRGRAGRDVRKKPLIELPEVSLERGKLPPEFLRE